MLNKKAPYNSELKTKNIAVPAIMPESLCIFPLLGVYKKVS